MLDWTEIGGALTRDTHMAWRGWWGQVAAPSSHIWHFAGSDKGPWNEWMSSYQSHLCKEEAMTQPGGGGRDRGQGEVKARAGQHETARNVRI